MQTSTAQVYRNAMETLVADEVKKQFMQVPPRLTRYLNRNEVIAFALNRLPALYATSEKGWRQQCLKGKRDYGEQVVTAVRQGILAVQKDPLRIESPIAAEVTQESAKALEALGKLLQCDDLSWQNMVIKVEESLAKAARGEIIGEYRAPIRDRRSDWNSSFYRH